MIIVIVALLAAACSAGGGSATIRVAEGGADTPTANDDTGATHRPVREYPDAIIRRMRRLANEPRPVEHSAMPPRHLDVEQFPVSLVPRDQIVSGGPPPDGIPPIDDPAFAPAATIDWLADDEAVMVLQVADAVRVYPVQIMIWHEIVNDVVAGVPVAVTYCPLCNSAVAFDRRVEGRTLDFGTSGALYQSALVMYDRQTESLWTHFDGRAVVGTLAGAQLTQFPVTTVAWRDARRVHPDASVLTRDTGVTRPYGENPYGAYDSRDTPLTGFFVGDPDARTDAMRRVVGIHGSDTSVAIPTARVARAGVVATELGGRAVTVWHVPGTASPLGGDDITDGADVGATAVYAAIHDGAALSFSREGRRFVDDRTGSRWNILGQAVDGPLRGAHLQPIPHLDTFWFAWATYRPETVLLD